MAKGGCCRHFKQSMTTFSFVLDKLSCAHTETTVAQVSYTEHTLYSDRGIHFKGSKE